MPQVWWTAPRTTQECSIRTTLGLVVYGCLVQTFRETGMRFNNHCQPFILSRWARHRSVGDGEWVKLKRPQSRDRYVGVLARFPVKRRTVNCQSGHRSRQCLQSNTVSKSRRSDLIQVVRISQYNPHDPHAPVEPDKCERHVYVVPCIRGNMCMEKP